MLDEQCVGAKFLKGEATALVTEANFNQCDGGAVKDEKILTHQFNIKHIFNPVHRWIRIFQRLIQATGQSEDKEMCGLVLMEGSDQ
jgi:hypothetical protein